MNQHTRAQQRAVVLSCVTAKYGFRFVAGWRPWQATGGAPHTLPPRAKTHRLALGQKVRIMRPMPGETGPHANSILNSLTVGTIGTVVEHYWPGKHLSGMSGRPAAPCVTNGFRVKFAGVDHLYDFHESEVKILAKLRMPPVETPE